MTLNYQSPWKKSSTNKYQFLWDSALPTTRNHPYLSRKKIKPHGIKVSGDNLVIPIYNTKKDVCGIQTITPDGIKKFEYESKIEGNFYPLNENSDDTVFYITEGFATAASIAEATGSTVICSFSAGNLEKVAKVIREKTENVIVIAADNKSKKEVEQAEKAALACDGFVALSSEGLDFNDMACEGIDINDALAKIYKPEIKIEPVKEYKDYSAYDENFDKETIEDMLNSISPDVCYQDWIEIGMALKSAGASLAVWDNWSKGSAKYKKNDCRTHWQSFRNSGITIGTLVHHAQLNGWEKKYPIVETKKQSNIDINAIVENSNKRKIKALKIDVMEFDGLIGETVNWIVNNSTFKQPMLATLNVLAVLGAVFGRKYASKINTRTNIYTVGVAATGLGKETSRRMLANLCNEAGFSNILGDNGVRSDSGMVKSLSIQASQVMMIDEFGDFLKGLKDTKAAGHIKAVSRLLLQLYSTSSGIYKHGTYATEKMESMILHCPNLCIYGTTTEEIYASSISKEGIKSGELNRFIVLPGDDNAAPCHDAENTHDVPQNLLDAWKALDVNPTNNNLAETGSGKFAPKPSIIGWGVCWQTMCQLLDYQHSKRNEPNGALWVRYRENIIKIAMIYCLSEGKAELEEKHVNTARHYVDLSIKYMDKLARSHMADNQWEELHNEFVAVLEKNKGEMQKSKLAKAMKKVRRRDFNEMLESMKEAETIVIEGRTNEGTVGRPTVYVRLL